MVMTGGAVRYGARVARLVARVLGLTATEGHEPNNDNNKDRETSNPRSVPLRTLSLTHAPESPTGNTRPPERIPGELVHNRKTSAAFSREARESPKVKSKR